MNNNLFKVLTISVLLLGSSASANIFTTIGQLFGATAAAQDASAPESTSVETSEGLEAGELSETAEVAEVAE